MGVEREREGRWERGVKCLEAGRRKSEMEIGDIDDRTCAQVKGSVHCKTQSGKTLSWYFLKKGKVFNIIIFKLFIPFFNSLEIEFSVIFT